MKALFEFMNACLPEDSIHTHRSEERANEMYEAYLRDYYAGLAMQGFLANIQYSSHIKLDFWAKESYEIASEMIKARKK